MRRDIFLETDRSKFVRLASVHARSQGGFLGGVDHRPKLEVLLPRSKQFS
jgi:hypothetical protein